jgi:hypothetical protein
VALRIVAEWENGCIGLQDGRHFSGQMLDKHDSAELLVGQDEYVVIHLIHRDPSAIFNLGLWIGSMDQVGDG